MSITILPRSATTVHRTAWGALSGMTFPSCVECPAGMFDGDSDGPAPCAACPVGTQSSAGATECSPCPDGFVDADQDPSTPCVEATVVTTPIATDGNWVVPDGEVTSDVDEVWYSFQAEEGQTYQLESECGSLPDTVLRLIDVDQVTVLIENDDDERVTDALIHGSNGPAQHRAPTTPP